MAKLILVFVAFVAWMGWQFATARWGAFFVFVPAIGAAITAQLIVFRLIARLRKDV